MRVIDLAGRTAAQQQGPLSQLIVTRDRVGYAPHSGLAEQEGALVRGAPG